jgi:hypothetical protein
MSPAQSAAMIEDRSDTPVRIEIQEVESPSVQARQVNARRKKPSTLGLKQIVVAKHL